MHSAAPFDPLREPIPAGIRLRQIERPSHSSRSKPGGFPCQGAIPALVGPAGHQRVLAMRDGTDWMLAHRAGQPQLSSSPLIGRSPCRSCRRSKADVELFAWRDQLVRLPLDRSDRRMNPPGASDAEGVDGAHLCRSGLLCLSKAPLISGFQCHACGVLAARAVQRDRGRVYGDVTRSR